MAASKNTIIKHAPGVEELVFAERVYTVLRFTIASPVAAVVGAAAIAALAWDQPGPAWAAGWFAVLLSVTALWMALLVAFRRAEPGADHIGSWYQRALVCS